MSEARRRPERVGLETVLPLRAAVLRPGRAPQAAEFPGDHDPDTVHLAVLERGAPIAVASLYRRPPPGSRSPRAWQLRSMATAPERRRLGHARALIRAAAEHVRERGGGWLWCNARARAAPLYLACGFTIEGGRFEVPGIGPHYLMTCAASAAAGAAPGAP